MTKKNDMTTADDLDAMVKIHRDQYNEARFEYELTLRRFLSHHVNNCSCCFKGFYSEVEKSLSEEASQAFREIDELEVLEGMRSLTKRIYSFEDQDEHTTIQ
jgi:hypothetical protein